MIVVMAPGTAKIDLDNIKERIESRGLRAQINTGAERTVIGVMGSIPADFKDEMELMNGVDEVVMISKPYKLASREFHPDDTIIKVGDAVIGGPDPVIMAGPCSVEDEEQMVSTARRSRLRVRRSFEVGPSSRALLHTASEEWVSKAWNS